MFTAIYLDCCLPEYFQGFGESQGTLLQIDVTGPEMNGKEACETLLDEWKAHHVEREAELGPWEALGLTDAEALSVLGEAFQDFGPHGPMPWDIENHEAAELAETGEALILSVGIVTRQAYSDDAGPDEITSIWDNGGKTFDRYTVFFDFGEVLGEPSNIALGLSSNPSSPIGFSQFTESAVEGEHLGARIEWQALPQQVRDHIKARIAEPEDDQCTDESASMFIESFDTSKRGAFLEWAREDMDKGDLWGWAMGWLFDLCASIQLRGGDVPPELGYSAGALGPCLDDMDRQAGLSEFPLPVLIYSARVLGRYVDRLKRAGLDY